MEIMLLIKELPNNFLDELPRRNYKKTHIIKAIGKLLFRGEDGTAEKILEELRKETNEIDERPGDFRRDILVNPQRISHHLVDEGLILYSKEKTKGEKYYFFPSAIIYKKSGKIYLDLTDYFPLEEIPDVLKEKLKIKCKDSEVSLMKLLNDISILLSEIKILKEIEIMRELMEYAKNKDANFFNNNDYSDIKKDIYTFYNNKIFELPTSIPLYTIGDLKLNFILWWGTGKKGEEFNYENISCECVNEPLQTPKEILSLMEQIIDEKRKNANEHGQVFDNHPGYRLIKITPTRRFFPTQKIRRLEFHLTFTNTDFFTCVSTNLSVDKSILDDYRQNKISIRRKYVNNQNLSDSNYLIDSKLSNMFGIALATITKDNKILLQKRSHQVLLGPSKITLATAEHMIKGIDEDEYGNPNLFIASQRCLKEEIGVEVELEDIVFLGLGIRLDNLLPQALGIVKLRLNSTELSNIKARDRWEGSNFVEEFSINSLKKYLKLTQFISDTAKLTILLALINQYGFEEVETQILD